MQGLWDYKLCLVKLGGRCDAPKPGGPVDHHQPTETYVSHIMRPIYE